MVSKQDMLEYVKKYHGENGKGPSVRQILEKFSIAKIHFYDKRKGFFPGGKPEIYRLAGIPYTGGRMREARKAKKEKKVREKEKVLGAAFDMILSLNAELVCLKNGYDDRGYMEMLSEDTDWDVLKYMKKVAELDPAFGKLLLKNNSYLDYMSCIWEETTFDKLNSKKDWFDLLRKRCPNSKYLRSLKSS